MVATQSSNERKIRFQMDLSERKSAELDRLVEVCDFGSKKELFNTAVSLLVWAVGEVRAGRKIASIDQSHQSYRELTTPTLTAAASHDSPQAEREAVAIG